MKKIENCQLCLILVTGLPASGKSRLANYLGRELDLPVLEKDHYKEILFDDIGFKSRGEKIKLGTAAMDIMYDHAALFLSRGSSVILDNNFESASLPGLSRLCDRFKFRLITVRVSGDVSVIYKRFVERDCDPSRHRGHVVNSRYPEEGTHEAYVPMSLDAFEKSFHERGMMDFYPGGELIEVDATSFETDFYPDVLARICRAMER